MFTLFFGIQVKGKVSDKLWAIFIMLIMDLAIVLFVAGCGFGPRTAKSAPVVQDSAKCEFGHMHPVTIKKYRLNRF